MTSPNSSLHRFLNFVRGDPEGGALKRAQYYVFTAVAGGIVGFFVVAMATPSRERGGGQGFSLEIYLGAIAAGAVLALAIVIVPRLLRPKDWPTREEFRRGAEKKDDGGSRRGG